MLISDADIELYHTKNYQGTTTMAFDMYHPNPLYHTKNYQGTTTFFNHYSR